MTDISKINNHAKNPEVRHLNLVRPQGSSGTLLSDCTFFTHNGDDVSLIVVEGVGAKE